MKYHKKEQGMRKTRFWVPESVTCGEGISIHNIRPKMVPLIKCAKLMWFFSKYLIFPKNINKRMYKKQQNYFFFGPGED